MEALSLLILTAAPVIDPGVVTQNYFGPDTIMPLGSAIAAGIGILLMFWRRVMIFVRGVRQRFRGE